MGLFDAYFDPGTYQGNSGGLIDRLLAQLGPQAQYQPSPGFPQPDPSAAPISVGNYQMPRMGSADLYQPQQAMLPANAQPTQGQFRRQCQFRSRVKASCRGKRHKSETRACCLLKCSRALGNHPFRPPQLQQPGNGFGDHLSAGLNSFAGNLHNGLVGSIIGGVGGLVTGQRNDPQGIQQQNLRAQYDALIAAGIPEPKARLCRHQSRVCENDHSGSVRQGQVSGRQDGPEWAWHRTVRDFQSGNRTASADRPSTADDSGGGLGNMDLSGKDYLASLPKAQANIVQGMVEGTIAPPSSFALAKPYWQNMISAAKNYDPTFDATNWSGRVAGTKDFSSGKSSEMVRSANQTIGHIGDLIDKMDALKNGDYPLKNKVGNYINSEMGGAAVTGFQQTAHAVADELSKVFKGAGISDSEIRQWEQNLSPDMSPAQQREAVTTAMSLLQHSLSALEEKRLNSIGPVAAEKAGPLLKPDAQAAIDRIQKWAAQDKPAATTRTGVKWSVE